jgi:hypothetical protein
MLIINPSHSSGRFQDDRRSKQAPGKQFKRPYVKNTQHKKRAGGVAHVVELLPIMNPVFKPQDHKKKNGLTYYRTYKNKK